MRNIGHKPPIPTKVSTTWWVEEILIISGEEVIAMRYKISTKLRESPMRHGKSCPFQKPLEITAWLLSKSRKYTLTPILVDAFGAVPYTESLDLDILQPKYDDGAEVYNALIRSLNAAIGDD